MADLPSLPGLPGRTGPASASVCTRRLALHTLLLAAPGPLVAQGVAGSTAADPAGAERTLWRSHFAAGLADWRGLGSVWGGHNHQFMADPEVAGQVLRVRIQQGSIDPGSMTRRGLPRAGTGFKARVIDGGRDRATLRYRLRFAAGFDFVRGGKLPGLFGGQGQSGGRLPDGTDGFSLRLMWRERGAAEVYAYLPPSANTHPAHGTSLQRGQFVFTPGRWHTVVQQVQLNTPGHSDGVVRMVVDNQPPGVTSGLRLRDVATLRLDGVFFDLFFGGSDDSWAARSDTHVDFAEFEVSGPAAA